MAAGSFVVVRRTISQTIVPYKDVEERLLLKKSRSKSTSLGFSSTNNVARCGVPNTPDPKKTQRLNLERSRSEVCLRRKSSYVRESSLDVFEERCEEGFVKQVVRRREIRRANTARPRSDFFPEFSIENNKTAKVKHQEITGETREAEKRLGRCIATLRREMISLRKQDQDLLKQLTSLNEHIQDLKEITKAQGGFYGATEDREEQSLPSTTLNNPGGPTTNLPSAKTATTGKKQREKISVTSAEEEVQKIQNNNPSTGKKIKNEIEGLQETSFEYIEAPCTTPSVKTARSKTTKRSQSATIADLSRKKIASLRSQRKSLSCQTLNSGDRVEFSKGRKTLFAESHETLTSTDLPRKTRPLSQINTEEDVHDTKHKSLSLSQLRSRSKNTEGSTSDSECSTSGCYGGSSTGSDVEVERSYFNARGGRDSNEKLDKLYELNSLNLKSFGKKHPANTQGQFRKKIVSV